MQAHSIIDSRLCLNVDLDHTLKVNSLFLSDPANRAHLANQLLLYDQIIIPTKDFGIVPILISWFGLKHFRKVLGAGTLAFLHKPSILGYAGNGVGLSGFIIKPSEKRSFDWWQHALFGKMDTAIDMQLGRMCPFIGSKQRSKLVYEIIDHSLPLEYDNELFMKSIVNESYTDIMESKELSGFITLLSGNPKHTDLTRLPGIEENQLKVSNFGPIKGPADLVLRIAEINISILMSTQLDESDLYAPQGAEKILTSKLERAGITPPVLQNFIQLLELSNIPDPGAAVRAGDATLQDIWKIRQKRVSRKFRKWLRTAVTGDARELEKMYVSSLGRKSFYESLPSKLIRLAITTAAGALLPVAGLALDIADSFFVEKWVQGYSPKLFLDTLSSIHVDQATGKRAQKSRRTN